VVDAPAALVLLLGNRRAGVVGDNHANKKKKKNELCATKEEKKNSDVETSEYLWPTALKRTRYRTHVKRERLKRLETVQPRADAELAQLVVLRPNIHPDNIQSTCKGVAFVAAVAEVWGARLTTLDLTDCAFVCASGVGVLTAGAALSST
jgi:hypothetical protein